MFRSVLIGHQDPELRATAWAAKCGDPVAVMAVRDLMEEGKGSNVYIEDISEVVGVGDGVLLMTDTFYWIGRVKKLGNTAVILEEAAWIADLGRFQNSMANGMSAINEAEPVPGNGVMAVMNEHIRTILPWNHSLIRIIIGG